MHGYLQAAMRPDVTRRPHFNEAQSISYVLRCKMWQLFRTVSIIQFAEVVTLLIAMGTANGVFRFRSHTSVAVHDVLALGLLRQIPTSF